VIQIAREAMQAAEDARLVADQRRQQDTLTKAQAEAARAQHAQSRAEAEIANAKTEAAVARSQAESERAAREHAEADAAFARDRAIQAEAKATQPTQIIIEKPTLSQPTQTALRSQLFGRLNSVSTTLDTPRGLVLMVPEQEIAAVTEQGLLSKHLTRVSEILASQPALRVDVDGYSDAEGSQALSLRRAGQIRDMLVDAGLDPHRISVHGFGNARPLASNATANGREQNRRVEIVISGDEIGNLPLWDRTYSISRR
jgi:flagellar motor protein MotB